MKWIQLLQRISPSKSKISRDSASAKVFRRKSTHKMNILLSFKQTMEVSMPQVKSDRPSMETLVVWAAEQGPFPYGAAVVPVVSAATSRTRILQAGRRLQPGRREVTFTRVPQIPRYPSWKKRWPVWMARIRHLDLRPAWRRSARLSSVFSRPVIAWYPSRTPPLGLTCCLRSSCRASRSPFLMRHDQHRKHRGGGSPRLSAGLP